MTTPAGTSAARTIRLLEAAEVAGAVHSMERWDDVSGSLAATYPQVLAPQPAAGARVNLFGLFAGDELISHAAAHSVRIHVGDDTVRVALVGSVATAPEHRRQGLASDLLRHITTVAAAAGCDALMLWSDRWEFYDRLGFAPAGHQLEVSLRPDPGAAIAVEGIRPMTVADHPAVLTLHHRKPLAVNRFAADLAVLLAARPMTSVVLESDGAVVAYACRDKGVDFTGWWHEVGGSDQDVARLLLGAMRLDRLDQAMLLVPPYRGDLIEPLEPHIEHAREGVSGLILPLTERGCRPLFVDGLDSI